MSPCRTSKALWSYIILNMGTVTVNFRFCEKNYRNNGLRMTMKLDLWTVEQRRVSDRKYVRLILTNGSWILAHGGWILPNRKWSDRTLNCSVNDRWGLARLQKKYTQTVTCILSSTLQVGYNMNSTIRICTEYWYWHYKYITIY
jgi:hypothetical protein